MTDRYETIFLREDNKEEYTDLEITNGSIIVETSADLTKLREVGGDIYINTGNIFNVSNLDSVGGNIRLEADATLNAENLEALGGGIYLCENSKVTLDKLACVGNYVKINSDLELSNLRSIGGFLHINKKGSIKADKLEYVSGFVHVDANTELNSVIEVGGDIYINSKATLTMNNLKFVGGNCNLYKGAVFSSNAVFKDKSAVDNTKRKNFEIFNELGYLFSDSILAKIIRHKKTIYKVKLVGEGHNSYCLEVEGMYSHGDTLEKAREGIVYKIKNRDTSAYGMMDLDTELTYEETVKMYRVITGACEKGTKRFIEQNKDRIQAQYVDQEKHTIREIMEFLKGVEGADILYNYFKDWY